MSKRAPWGDDMNDTAEIAEAEIIASLREGGADVEVQNRQIIVHLARTEELVRLAARLDRLGSLRSPFWASGPALTGAEFRFLTGHKNLRELDITNMPISGEHLGVVATLPKLEVLRCTPKEKVKEAMAAIGKCKGLRVLTLDGGNISDESLGALRHLLDVEELSLSQNPVASGASVVKSMTRLRKLSLEGTAVDGMDRKLRSFRGQPVARGCLRVMTSLSLLRRWISSR
jgi:hypothetical protein